MHAVSFGNSRSDGLTSDDSVIASFFGKNTPKFTARGHKRTLNWLAGAGSVWDRPPYHPSASGHGHRP